MTQEHANLRGNFPLLMTIVYVIKCKRIEKKK